MERATGAVRAFHVMLKPRGAICNLGCRYCFYLSKEALYPGASFRMSDAVLAEFTRQYIEAQQAPEITFAWQGGEPTLMGLDFFRRAVALQKQYARPGVRINNAFQTNGILLDDDWCAFLHEHGFLVGLSLDGPRHLHDVYRVDKGGQPTFDRVMRGLALLQKHHVEFNILSCVSAANAAHPIQVYRFYRDEVGAQFIQFIPIVEKQPGRRGGQPLISTRSVTGKQYGSFLIGVFDEWVRRDVGRVYVQTFDVALAAWLGQRPGLCIFEPTCGLAMAMEHDGDLYSCDHFVEPRYKLGNIMRTPLAEMVDSPKQRQFGLDKRATLPRQCRVCSVRFVCNGACPKDRVLKTAQGEAGLNYLCDGYKAFFTHIDGPMRTMAQLLRAGRAPAEIMTMVTSARPAGAPPDRPST